MRCQVNRMWQTAYPLLPSPGNPGEGRVRVYPVNTIRQSNILRRNPHPDLLPAYREKEKCAHAIALHAFPIGMTIAANLAIIVSNERHDQHPPRGWRGR
jgi:hypothetical protein